MGQWIMTLDSGEYLHITVGTLQFSLKLDNKWHFSQKPTCIPMCESDWVVNPHVASTFHTKT